jgi:spore coat polysaccharide biosynthesis predicted glycosyltransferase SpsG/CMP-N-acetylneuraminic acid synthetase
MRFLCGKPLIWYALQTAVKCGAITDVAVTSDDEETLAYAGQFDCAALKRGPRLSSDSATLDPVVHDAVLRMEASKRTRYDYVVTLQATSPLLSVRSLSAALGQAQSLNLDTLISVEEAGRLSWRAENGGFAPNYAERLNRQQLPKEYRETGAFLISRRGCVTESSRIGRHVGVFPLPENEAVDVDTINDWSVCEAVLKRRKIVFRVDGSRSLGMGHIYHTLALAYRLTGHEISFVTGAGFPEGRLKLEQSNFKVVAVDSDDEFFDYLSRAQADIAVIDCLNTAKDFMLRARQAAKRLVSIEDLGEGAIYADATINALYEGVADNRSNCYSGCEYACLREEFQLAIPKGFSREARRVFVMFGGSDPGNYTRKIYDFALEYHKTAPRIRFDFVAGLAYDPEKFGVVTREDANVFVYHDSSAVSRYMREADLAIIGQGRSIFETASLGIPTIVMAQNFRERAHTFASLGRGFINLGLGDGIHRDTLEKTVTWLIDTPQIREEMRAAMLSFDLKSGVDRVVRIVLGEQ